MFLLFCASCKHTVTIRYKKTYSQEDINIIYNEIKPDLEFEVFERAIIGLNKLKKIKRRHLITIIDYSKPSNYKRLYVFDLHNKEILFHCLVSHGVNSGKTSLDRFSNVPESRKSSVGFMKAAEPYEGKHGLSIRLDGLEKGINDNVRVRDIVIHSADYATEEFLEENGYLGRSYGCPAISPDISDSLIEYISHGSCIYIHTEKAEYLEKSNL